MDGRTPAVKVCGLRIGSDESLFISRLELVRVLGEDGQIGNAEIAGTGRENFVKDERAQCRVAAGASAANGHAIPVDVTSFLEISSSIDAILHVDDPPLALEPLTIGATVSRTAAVVHIHDGEASRGP